MLVHEVMSSPVVTVGPATTLKQAAQLLEENAVTSMPVLDEAGLLVGVVSEADLIVRSLPADPRVHERPVPSGTAVRPGSVAEVMTQQVISVPARADLAEVADLMTTTGMKSLPVLEAGEVVGMVSRRDIVRVLARRDEAIQVDVDRLLHSAGQDWPVEVTEGVVTVAGPEREVDRELCRVLARSVAGVLEVEFSSTARATPAG